MLTANESSTRREKKALSLENYPFFVLFWGVFKAGGCMKNCISTHCVSMFQQQKRRKKKTVNMVDHFYNLSVNLFVSRRRKKSSGGQIQDKNRAEV